MSSFTDQLGNSITLTQPPQRIISLVPSQTELLFDLGLGERIVGITKFCVHPKELVKEKIKIGGTKNFDLKVIEQLQPDLIIGNKEENYKEGIEALQKKYPVWMSDIFTLEDALQMILGIGDITGTLPKAQAIAATIQSRFAQLMPATPPIRVAYFIWRKPYLVAGANTFIDHVLSRCGFENIAGQLARYPELSPQYVQATNPQVILLSSEPFPFSEKHVEEFQQLCPHAKIKLVDGELFSWYGSRLLQSPAYLAQIITAVT